LQKSGFPAVVIARLVRATQLFLIEEGKLDRLHEAGDDEKWGKP